MFDRNDSRWNINERHDHEKFRLSVKVNAIGDCIHCNLNERKCPYLLQSNRHRHEESCNPCSYSGLYCDRNIKNGNEAYAAHLIFQPATIDNSTAFLSRKLNTSHTNIINVVETACYSVNCNDFSLLQMKLDRVICFTNVSYFCVYHNDLLDPWIPRVSWIFFLLMCNVFNTDLTGFMATWRAVGERT